VAPRYARAHYSLGMLHASSGRTDAAAEALANAARLAAASKGGADSSDTPEGGAVSASTTFSGTGSSDYGPDAPLVPVAVAKEDDELVHSEFGYLLALGSVRADQGRPAAAGKVFELALKLKPLAAPGWVALGGIRAKQGEAEKALAAFETALQCDPRSADAHYGLGSCLLVSASTAAEKDTALKHIERAVELDPLHAAALAKLASHAVGGEYLSAVRSFQAAADSGGGAANQGSSSKSASASSSSAAEPLSLAASLFGLAATLDSQGVLPYRALDLLEKSVELEPGRSSTHLVLGRTLAKLERWNDAIRAFRSAIRLDARNVDAFFELGYALLANKESSAAAVASSDQALEGASDASATPVEASSSSDLNAPLDYSTGLVMDAEHVFKAAIDLAPERNELYVGLAKAMQTKQQWTLAVQAWQRAVATDPDQAAWQLGLGVAARKSGDLKLSASALRKCIEVDGESNPPRAMRAVRLLIRVLKAIVAGEEDTGKGGSSMDKGARVQELRVLTSSLIERLEKRLAQASAGNDSSAAALDLDALVADDAAESKADAKADASDETGNNTQDNQQVSVGGVTAAERTMSEIGALYVILGRLWLTPATGTRVGEDGEATEVTPEEEKNGVEAFRKGAAFAAFAAAHQPAAAAALAPVYEASAQGGLHSYGGYSGAAVTVPRGDAKMVAASLCRRALGGVLTALGGAGEADDSLPVGPKDVTSLVLCLNRTAGDDAGVGCSPSAAHLLMRTLFVTPDHPMWRGAAVTSSTYAMVDKTEEASEQLHSLLAAYLAGAPAGRAASRTGALLVKLATARAQPTTPSAWLNLAKYCALTLELRYADLVDPLTTVHGWAQGSSPAAAASYQNNKNHRSGPRVTVGATAAQAILALGLSSCRHATTLSLGDPQAEAEAWLWCGTFAEALGDFTSAKQHYTRSCDTTPDAPAPAVRLAKLLLLLQAHNMKNKKLAAAGMSDSSGNTASSEAAEAAASSELMARQSNAEQCVQKALALDPYSGTSAAEATLQGAMHMLRAGDADSAIAGFLEVAFRKAMAPARDVASNELVDTAVLGLIDGVVQSVQNATQAQNATPSGESGAPAAASSSDEDASTVLAEGLSVEVAAQVLAVEQSAPLLALERLLSTVGDTTSRASAVSRLCEVVGSLASDTAKQHGSLDARAGGGTRGGADIAVHLAVFNTVLKALPNVSAALPALHRLCVLARDLSLKAGRDKDAVGCLRTVLGYLAATAPDQQGTLASSNSSGDDAGALDGAAESGGLGSSSSDLMNGTGALKGHAGAWSMALAVFASMASYAAANGEEAKSLTLFTVALEYDSSYAPALDGIAALARQWGERDVASADAEADASALAQLANRAVTALRAVLAYNHGHSGAWAALAAVARALQRTRGGRSNSDTAKEEGEGDAGSEAAKNLVNQLLTWSAGEPAALVGLCQHAEELVLRPGLTRVANTSSNPADLEDVPPLPSSAGNSSAPSQDAKEDAKARAIASDLASAQAIFEAVLAQYPNHAAAVGGLAVLGAKLVDGATAAEEGGTVAAGQNQQLELQRGLSLLEAAVAAPTVSLSPAGTFARQKLASYHAARGAAFGAHGHKTAAAVAALRHAVSFHGPMGSPGSAGGDADADRVSLLVGALCRLGSDDLRERGDAAAAKRSFREALTHRPNSPAALRGLADAHMRHGIACAADGHPAEAAREFKKALARRGGVRNLKDV